MTFLDAPFWNQIARDEELQCEAAKVCFHFNREQRAKLDDLWMKVEAQAGTSRDVAGCLPICLPLLTEGDAINSFVDKHPHLRNALPEILSPAEATFYMTQDYRLSPEDQQALTQILTNPQPALERWHQAALMAKTA